MTVLLVLAGCSLGFLAGAWWAGTRAERRHRRAMNRLWVSSVRVDMTGPSPLPISREQARRN